jgi:CRISPR type III-A-associated RAMP protein Csm5
MLRFKVELETVTPIHIGCGEEYYPTEYFVDDKEKKLFVVDENKLLNVVEKKGKLEEFTKLASSYTQTNSALLAFIKSFSMNDYRYSVGIEPAAFNYITKQTAAFRAGISRFIRNRYDDKVYIPGSTVKGALRSAVIDFIIRRIEKRFEDKIDKEKFDRRTLLKRLRLDCSQLDSLLASEEKGNLAQRDIMKYVKVNFNFHANYEKKI